MPILYIAGGIAVLFIGWGAKNATESVGTGIEQGVSQAENTVANGVAVAVGVVAIAAGVALIIKAKK